MALKTVYGKLDAEDLARVRMNDARCKGIELKPSAYSRDEIEQAQIANDRLMGEIAEKYGVPGDGAWSIYRSLGHIVMED